MKKLLVLIGLAGLLCAPALQAAMVTPFQNPANYSSGNGGEFRAMPSVELNWVINNYSDLARNALGQGGFQTFCIETSEFFSPGTAYTATINDRAMFGSAGSGGDPISIGTAWLYRQFASGTLSGYDYGYGNGPATQPNPLGEGNRVASAGLLQQAIWFLEEETGGVDNFYVNLARTSLSLDNAGLQASQGGTHEYGVRALNLTDTSGGLHQDQLVVVPEPTTMIAGALLLLPFGVSTLRILRKKYVA